MPASPDVSQAQLEGESEQSQNRAGSISLSVGEISGQGKGLPCMSGLCTVSLSIHSPLPGYGLIPLLLLHVLSKGAGSPLRVLAPRRWALSCRAYLPLRGRGACAGGVCLVCSCAPCKAWRSFAHGGCAQ